MTTKFRKIATEEAFTIPEVAAALKEVVRGPSTSLDRILVRGIYDPPEAGKGYDALGFLGGLLDVEERRLAQMDEYGVDMQILSLTAPGVQMFDADTATDLARLAGREILVPAGHVPGVAEIGHAASSSGAILKMRSALPP